MTQETGKHIGKVDQRYVLPKDGLDERFKESFITAPSHLEFPTRNHYAFLEGVIGINPAQERVLPGTIVDTWKQGIIQGNGNWRFMSPADKREFMNAAKAITNDRVPVPDIDTALRILGDQVYMVTDVSLDKPAGDTTKGTTLMDLIDIPDTSDPVKKTLSAEDIEELLAELTPREADVLRKRQSMTQEEIGREYGVTKQRIDQIEKKAYRKLRQPHLREKVVSLMERIS
ncbi:MAG: sigma-70 family RNA polymerase sigma factor [Candidatus Levyibacteriota bacterium]